MLAQKFVFKLLNLKKSSSILLMFSLFLAPSSLFADGKYSPLTDAELVKLAVYMGRSYIIASPVRNYSDSPFPTVDSPEVQRPTSPAKKGKQPAAEEIGFDGLTPKAVIRYDKSALPVYVCGPRIQD